MLGSWFSLCLKAMCLIKCNLVCFFFKTKTLWFLTFFDFLKAFRKCIG